MNNLNELRQAILDTVEQVRTGKMKAHDAMAVAKNAQAVINLTRLELDYAQVKHRVMGENIGFLEAPKENTVTIDATK